MKKRKFCIIIFLFFTSCKQPFEKDSITRLHYDLFKADSLTKKDALVVEYNSKGKDSFRMVNIINRADTTGRISFAEKVNSDGIYRSFNSINFSLTHSFVIGKKIESDLGQVHPIFVNSWITAMQEKNYFSGKDTMRVLFFDEIIPMYSATNEYYSKALNFFLVYYDAINNSYYKLSEVEGDKNSEAIKIADEISEDTTFFGKYRKLPKKAPPPLKEKVR